MAAAPSPRWAGTTSYRPGSDGGPRPYLWLDVAGPYGGSPVAINGLVDSGADTSVLPLDYLGLLGYTTADVERTQINQVEGSADAWKALVACVATVPGGPDHAFELLPLFVDGSLNVLWGRADFMMAYDVEFHEAHGSFTLRLR